MKIKKIVSLGKRLYVELPSSWVSRNELLPGDTVYIIENDGEIKVIPLPSQRKK